MHSIIMKISHSLGLKDSIAVGRGLYRVFQGSLQTNRSNLKATEYIPPSVISDNDKIEDIKIYYKQQYPKQQIAKPTQKLKQQQSPLQQDYRSKISQINSKSMKSFQVGDDRTISSVPAGRFKRFFEFTKLGKSILEFSVQAYVAKNISGGGEDKVYEKAAEKITNQLCKMRGAPLKLAQMLSIQEDDLIPTPIRKAFEKARETAHIMPTEETILMMKENFGEDWSSKFKSFNEKPFASASIGQVHKAQSIDGKDVAIKIQYPGVKTSIKSDIGNLTLLMKIPGLFPKGIYIQKILKKTEEQLNDECDYVKEAKYQNLYRQCLNQAFKQEKYKFKVPRIFNYLSTESILTSEYLSGITMSQIQQSRTIPQQLKDQIGYRIMKLTFKELFQMGIMQSDPNPSNYTYNIQNDSLNLFDFGAVHLYKRSFLQEYFKIIQGSINESIPQIMDGSIKTGFLTGQQNQTMKQNHIKSILMIGEPLRYNGKYDFSAQQITKRIYKTIPLMLKNRLKAPPEQVYSLHRKLSGSYLACIRLGAKVNCYKILKQIQFATIASNIKLS